MLICSRLLVAKFALVVVITLWYGFMAWRSSLIVLCKTCWLKGDGVCDCISVVVLFYDLISVVTLSHLA